MLVTGNFAQPAVWKPDTEGNTQKQLAGPCEVTVLKLISSAGAATASIYDGTSSLDVGYGNLKYVLDASTQDDDINIFYNPLVFKKGVFAVLEQGANLNAQLCIAIIPVRPA